MGTALGRRDFQEVTDPLAHVAFDTQSCIYQLNDDPLRSDAVVALMVRAAAGTLRIHLPGIVEMELFVRPYRSYDLEELKRVRELVFEKPGLQRAPISEQMLLVSAELRAMTDLRVPDALMVGSALVAGCEAIVGNDKNFRRLEGFGNVSLLSMRGRNARFPRYIHLDDYID